MSTQGLGNIGTDNTPAKKSRFMFFSDVYRPDAKVARFLMIIILTGVSFSLYRGVQDNYLADLIHITPFERGVVEFFRELPGLILVFILALMYRLTPGRIFKIGLALMAAGAVGVLLTTASSHLMTKLIVVIFMVLLSLGDHITMPVRSTIALDLAKREKAGASLGILGSLYQLGHIAGFLVVMGIFYFLSKMGYTRTDILGYRIVLGLSVALVTAAVLVAAALQETAIKTHNQRFYFARKFFKFYMIEVFQGARRQVFSTFAPYVLILHYRADPALMSLLYAICSIFGFVCGHLMGRLIDRLGYKVVMVGNALVLILICFFYGYAHRVFPMKIAFIVICCNFVLDSVISMASMATNVYAQRISSSQEELTATLSTGMSVNHAISIFIALVGGWIWAVTGIEVLFAISAFLGLLQAIYSATVKKSEELS